MEAIMNRSFVFTRAVLAVIGLLLLVGPQKASAQTVFACKDNTSGILFFYATSPSAGCGSGRTLETFNLTGGGGGLLAGAANQCVINQTIAAGGALNFASTGVSFGSAIGTAGSTFGSFVLQAGTYQISLSGINFVSQTIGTFSIVADLNNVATTSWPTQPSLVGMNPATFDIVGGDRLISVASNNTTLQFIPDAPKRIATTGTCWLNITKLQ
jgi:hypothetical protein